MEIVDPALVDHAALVESVPGVMRLNNNVLHLIVGPKAEAIATALASSLRVPAL